MKRLPKSPEIASVEGSQELRQRKGAAKDTTKPKQIKKPPQPAGMAEAAGDRDSVKAGSIGRQAATSRRSSQPPQSSDDDTAAAVLSRSQIMRATGRRSAIGAGLAFVLIVFRVVGAWVLPMTDCDETFNYWEPAHWLAFGSGMQTWEYADVFALRSWLFVWLYAWPSVLVSKVVGAEAAAGFGLTKPVQFYITKSLIAAVTANAEIYAIRGIGARFGHRASKVAFVVALSSAGIALAAPQFLPSSFAMVCNMVALGAWLRLDTASLLRMNLRHAVEPTIIAVAACSAGAIVGWPFAALTAIPIALDVITCNVEMTPKTSGIVARCLKGFGRVLGVAIIAAFAWAAAVAAVDTVYYCRPVFSTWQLVEYNVLSSGKDGRGPELYGVEPWHFFFKNLALNFTVLFAAALAAPVVLVTIWVLKKTGGVSTRRRAQSVVGSPIAAAKFGEPFVLWFAFWLFVPHKEERFMAPVYGFIACSATLVITATLELSSPPQLVSTGASKPSTPNKPTNGGCSDGCCGHNHHGGVNETTMVLRNHTRAPLRLICRFVTAVFLSLALVGCLGRLSAMHAYYKAPESSAWALHDRLAEASRTTTTTTTTVCLGRDWFRFPSSFFVPSGATYRFAKTSFDGALPKPFDETLGSCAAGGDGAFNDLNKENPGQSVAAADVPAVCDVYVDSFVAGPIGDLPVSASATTTGDTPTAYAPMSGVSRRMLDAGRTSLLCRLAFIPAVSEGCAMWGDVFALAKDPALIQG